MKPTEEKSFKQILFRSTIQLVITCKQADY